MIAPYDIMWNGKLYPAGELIPAHEKKLIQSLTNAAESVASEDPIEDTEPATTKVKK